LADRDTRVEDLRTSVAERDQQISEAEAELLALKESRLFRLHNALAEPWSLTKLAHLGHFLASLVSDTRTKRGVPRGGRDHRAASITAIPEGREERFDPDVYRELYPDIDASGSDPYEHYAVFGRREGRIAWLGPPLDLSGLEPRRPTALVVFDEGSRTGAAVLGYSLVRRLLRDGSVVAFFYRPGPMMEACKEVGAMVLGPELWRGAPFPPPSNLIRRFVGQIAPTFAIVNGVEARHIVRSLAELYVPTISLIHEFSSNTLPRGAMTEMAFWSGATVFSAEVVRDNAWASEVGLAGIDLPVIPPGKFALSEADGGDRRDREIEPVIERALRPMGFPSDGIAVLGVGSIIPRNGVDLFIECANRVCESAPDLAVRFVWIGGTNSEADSEYSADLADQIRRAGLIGKVVVLGEVANLRPAYKAADVLLVTSRFDPLPNHVVDALADALPVVCFDRTTGIADVLKQNGLGEPCVASYLSPESMARGVIELARSPELRERIGADSARLAGATFDMDRYVSTLQDLVERQRWRAQQEHRAVDCIARSGLLQVDFVRPLQQAGETHTDTVRRYVRAWSSGINRRKPFPGFHPGIYLEEHGVERHGADPLVDYVTAGRPSGPWDFRLVTPSASPPPAVPPSLRVALHVHVHYPELLAAMLERLALNRTPIDLLVSATSDEARLAASAQLAGYGGGSFEVRLVPNRGRDIAPLLTEFADAIIARYDIVGHVHTKRTADLADRSIGEEWYRFLLENLLGGQARMADAILARMAAEPLVGMVFPDDPHVVGWTSNRAGAEALCDRLQLGRIPENPVFPVGSMFWARVSELRPLFGLGLAWEDYPEEPVPYDGTILHVIERILPMVATAGGGQILLTHVPGVTR
jgi:glycosyltransferase involved in cell wall biosynthesis